MTKLRAWLRPAFSGLTTRGRSFLAAGIAAGVCALVLDQRDLMRVAVLLAALPIGTALVLAGARYRLALTRTIAPQRVVAGTTARVRLELENLTRVGTRVLLAEDRVPYSLGPAPRFVLAKLPGGRRAAVTYSLRSEVRGRYEIGTLRLRLADPFGMCEVTRAFTATDPLVVVPRTWPLASVQAGGQWVGNGESLSRSAAASGEDDVATREYRYGDDLRRVHWRSTARRGELMVRRDEQPRQMRATILLDCRTEGHRGDGPASSFEWAVSAAASVGVHLAQQRYGVRMLLDERPASWTGPYQNDVGGMILDELAVVTLAGPQVLGGAVATLARSGGDGLVVAILGEVDEDVAMSLARLGRQGAKGIALLLRTPQWAALPPLKAEELDARRARVQTMLADGGWSAVDAGPNETVTQVWDRVAGRPLLPSPALVPVPATGYPGSGYADSGSPGNGYSGNGAAGNGYPGNGYAGNGHPGNGYSGNGNYGNGNYGNGNSGNGNSGNGHGGAL